MELGNVQRVFGFHKIGFLLQRGDTGAKLG